MMEGGEVLLLLIIMAGLVGAFCAGFVLVFKNLPGIVSYVLHYRHTRLREKYKARVDYDEADSLFPVKVGRYNYHRIWLEENK